MTGIYKKLESEIRTLFSLSIVNMIMAGMTMALGVAAGVNIATAGWDSMGFLVLIPTVLVAGIAVAIGINWLISIIDVLEGVEVVQDAYDEKKKEKSNTSVTSVIVQLMAVYREKKPKLEQMNKISRAAGLLFVIMGLLQAPAFLVTGMADGFSLLTVLTGVAGLVSIFGIGIACLLVPKYYARHSAQWDKRLAQSDKAEKELEKKLEGGL